MKKKSKAGCAPVVDLEEICVLCTAQPKKFYILRGRMLQDVELEPEESLPRLEEPC